MPVELARNVARTAARQHGIVTRRQLLEAGLTDDMIRSRVGSQLVRIHQGVYLLGTLVGPLRPDRYREMAAVLACGAGAAVSHRSALWIHGLRSTRPRGSVHVSVPDGRCRRPGITAHRVPALPDDDVVTVAGIRTTRVARTILDVAADATARELEQVMARAERAGLLEMQDLQGRLPAATGRPGAPLLRALLGKPTQALTRSEAEEQFLALVRAADLPEPEANVRVGRRELDFLWRAHRVGVEVDGFAYHGSRRAFEKDRARDFALAADGIEVHRVTWRQIVDQPLVVVRRLAATLARAETSATG